MRVKLGMLLIGAALMLIAFGCSAEKPTQPDTNQVRLRPVGVLQAPGIGDLVWLDANMNGIQDDPAEEPGLSGITVQLFSCADSTEVASETTDSMGLYGFDDLTPGDYYLHFVLPEGYHFSPMDVGTNDSLDSDADTLTGNTVCITIDSGQIDLTWDAGMYPPPPVKATIGDFVWEDLNQNGIQDSGEVGLGGINVRLISCDDTLMEDRTTISDADGMYIFHDVDPGNYRLFFVLPDGYSFSPMDASINDSIDSDVNPATGYTDCTHLDSGEVNLTVDAGMFLTPPPTAILGGFVWDDTNMNGIQDSGEAGIPMVAVYMTPCTMGDTIAVTDTMMTDTGGYYAFMELPPGDYKLQFSLPMGYVFSPMNQGYNDSLDSDVNPTTGYTECTHLDSGQVDLIEDAGMYLPSTGGCTYSKGYWKNHAGFGPQADMVTPLLPIWLGNQGGDKSLAVTDAQIAYNVLQQHIYGHPSNGITKLYAQLLTAKLNIANGAAAADIADVITMADDWLAMNGWMDWGNLSKQDRKTVLMWKNQLNAYNGGEIGPGHCGDDEHDGDWGDDNDGDQAWRSYRLDNQVGDINFVPTGEGN